MTATDSAVFVGFLAFLGVVLAPIVTGFLVDQRERRNARHDYIRSIVTALIDLRGELQYLQIDEWKLHNKEITFEELKETPRFREMQIAYGKAYAIMISVDIKEIRDIANVVTSSTTPDKKNEAIDFALKRIGEEYGLLKQDFQ